MIVIGLMSGTSLDGLDLAAIEFLEPANGNLKANDENPGFRSLRYKILRTSSIEYSTEWKKRLGDSPILTGFELRKLDVEYGRYLGDQINAFTADSGIKANLIASHGHTVFHCPEQGFTLQIGNGQYIKAKTGISTTYDFRTLDLAFGGQGAPLVPLGDELLFGEYDACLNLGGIANISYRKDSQRLAYDLCPCNLLLNHFAQKLGGDYDKNGQWAKEGKLNPKLLSNLNTHGYYQLPFPKSLDKEQVFKEFLPLLANIDSKDALNTLCTHIAQQIGISANGKLLVTGGGAFNAQLIQQITANWQGEVCIPNKKIIAFKEALIFALLGYLRAKGKTNVWASVTGASQDSCTGILV